MPYDGLQFLLSKTPGGILRHQAMIGEHNEMILKEWVGLSDEEFLDLLLSDALETS
jgi:crotonobetainyl-CoA:carnitine CoA-transferase CaiB-like acyl-CoA transferase